MSKGTIIGLVIAVVVIIAGVAGFALYRNNQTSNNKGSDNIQKNSEIVTDDNQEATNNNGEENKQNTDNTTSKGRKTLVVYYSAQTHTKRVAERVAKNLNADIFEIEPEDVYSDADLNWNNSNSRVSKEYNDKSLRNITLKSTNVSNWEDYDTVIVGYPIWWAIAAWPTDTFVKANDFTGKTVIPFCTSYSSGIGQSDKLLKNEAKGGDWKSGKRFHQDVDLSEVDKWTDGLEL